MKRFTVLFFALGLAASCGGSQSSSQQAHEVGVPSPSRFASKELCERTISNLERTEQDSTSTPVGEKGYFFTAEYAQRHRDRVYSCTSSLSEKEALCVADAPSLQYVRDCKRFALVR